MTTPQKLVTTTDYYNDLTETIIPKSIVCDQAEFDAVHDFSGDVDKTVIQNGVRLLTPCTSKVWGENVTPSLTDTTPHTPTITPALPEDDFLKRLLFSQSIPLIPNPLDTLKKIEASDTINNITDKYPWSDFIMNNYTIYSAYRPSFTRPCDGVDLKAEKTTSKTMDDWVKLVIQNCSGKGFFSDKEYWEKSYIQQIFDIQGIASDIFFICDVAKGNIKQDLYFADKSKPQNFYWLQTPQTIFDPAGKTGWSTGKEYGFRDENSHFKFAWQSAEPGIKRNYLYPRWDTQPIGGSDKWIDKIDRKEPDSIEKQICSSTNSYMITSVEQNNSKHPDKQQVSFYIQQPGTNKYVYTDNKYAAKSNINNISNIPSTDYVNSAKKYVLELMNFLSLQTNLTQINAQQLIANYTEPYMLMAKRFGDATQAAACCQKSIPYNLPSKTAYDESPSELNQDRFIDSIKDGKPLMTNGHHALVSYDRLCVATGLMFLAPIVIYSLDSGFIVFTKKELSSIDTKINNFYTDETMEILKCEELYERKKEMAIIILQQIKDNKIGKSNTFFELNKIKEQIEKICNIDTTKPLTVRVGDKDVTAHVPSWKIIKKMTSILKANKDIKKSKNESVRLFIGLIFSFSKYLLDITELENKFKEFNEFLETKFGIKNLNFSKKIKDVKDLHNSIISKMDTDDDDFTEERQQLLEDLTEVDTLINLFIREAEMVYNQSNLLFDQINEIEIMSESFDTHEAKVKLLLNIMPKDFYQNMNAFNLYDGIQSRLSARTSASTIVEKGVSMIKQIVRGKKALNIGDNEPYVSKDSIQLTHINQSMGLDNFILPVWRELKKTNNNLLISKFRTNIDNFYKSVYDEQFSKSVDKLSNRELNKKMLAEQGIKYLKEKLDIPNSGQLQTGGNRRFDLDYFQSTMYVDDIATKVFPLFIYQKITSLALNNLNDIMFTLIFSDENKQTFTFSDINNKLYNYLTTRKDFVDHSLGFDNTPFVLNITNSFVNVNDNGYAYMESPMYSFVEDTTRRTIVPKARKSRYNPFLEEIFVGENLKNSKIEVPMFMIIYNVSQEKFQKNPFSFIDFSYVLPKSYYNLEDIIDETHVLEEYKKHIISILHLNITKKVDFNRLDKIILKKNELSDILKELYKNIHELLLFRDVKEDRNQHRLFVEQNQLLDNYDTVNNACEENDIPVLLNEYFYYINNPNIHYDSDELHIPKLLTIFNNLTNVYEPHTITVNENNRSFWSTFVDFYNTISVELPLSTPLSTPLLNYQYIDDKLYAGYLSSFVIMQMSFTYTPPDLGASSTIDEEEDIFVTPVVQRKRTRSERVDGRRVAPRTIIRGTQPIPQTITVGGDKRKTKNYRKRYENNKRKTKKYR
jgi:hypothetical protein